ncbi:MAG: GNAT family N-acetyltransferase [Magnetococcales bacterium]|nr:GNAT family N-acetyltransferase [Magnetococcales bacterium]
MNHTTPQIVDITDKDIEPLSVYMEDFRGKGSDSSYWQVRFAHWWRDNPFYKAGMTRGLLLRDGGDIVGFVGTIPQPIQIGGKEVVAYISSSWGVEPQYRKYSMKLLARLLADLKQTGNPYIINNPIKDTDMFYKLLGLKKFPTCFGQKYTVYNGPLAQLSCKLSKDKTPQWLGMVLSAIEKRLYPLRNSSELHVEKISKAGVEFDELWQKSRYIVENTKSRTAASINWYCFGNKTYNNKLLFGVYSKNSLVGYAIFRDTRQGGGTFLECLDIWCDNQEQKIIQALLSYVLRYSSNQYYHGIITFDYAGIDGWLSICGTYEVEKKTVSGFYQLPKNMQQTITAENSYYVFAEGDVGI